MRWESPWAGRPGWHLEQLLDVPTRQPDRTARTAGTGALLPKSSEAGLYALLWPLVRLRTAASGRRPLTATG